MTLALRILGVLVVLAMPASAGATGVPLEHPLVSSVMTSRYIHVVNTGAMELTYGDAIAVFSRTNLLADVQSSYASMLPDGEKPEFEVIQTSPTAYYYINKNDERSDIEEVRRAIILGDDARCDVVYAVAGARWFGTFRAVIHVVVTPGDDGGVCFRSDVYAYPNNRAVRFFARHLGLVERYFTSKSSDMAALITRIGHRLVTSTPPFPVDISTANL